MSDLPKKTQKRKSWWQEKVGENLKEMNNLAIELEKNNAKIV